MEREPGKKLERKIVTYEMLSYEERSKYLEQAEYLKSRGYLIGKDLEKVAKDIYNTRRN